MTSLLAYLVAPYEDAALVPAWHTALANVGCTCVDTWAASVAPDLTQSESALRSLATAQEALILSAHVLAINARAGASYEMIRAASFALDAGIPVVWIGVDTLGSHRPYVHHEATLALGKAYIAGLVTAMQATLGSTGATLYTVRRGIQDYMDPPHAVTNQAPVLLGAGRMPVPDVAPPPSSAGRAAAPVVGAVAALGAAGAIAWVIHRRRTIGGK